MITPHPDVASGNFVQAEFAADLWQVYLGEGSSEYRDPAEFFRRTYITEGLRHLLAGALKKLSSGAGDPVIELQTNFGGGKTHSLLGLCHLFSGVAAGELAGMTTGCSGRRFAPPLNRSVGGALIARKRVLRNKGPVLSAAGTCRHEIRTVEKRGWFNLLDRPGTV